MAPSVSRDRDARGRFLRRTLAADLVATDPEFDDRADAAAGESDRDHLVQTFLTTSRDRWRTADAATRAMRDRMRFEQRFAAGQGNQWDAADKAIRTDEGRPCLEVNRIPQFVRQVMNQSRMNRSEIQVTPRGGGATVELAGTLQSLIRSVEVESDADIAYDTATDHQLRIGLGAVRLRATWANDTGFEQVCRIERLPNPLAIYKDPSTQDALWRDARWLHILQAVGKDEYEDRWGDVASYASLTEYVHANSGAQDWMPEGKVILAEYFYVEVERKTLLQMADGTELWDEYQEEWAKAWAIAYPGLPVPEVARRREVNKRVVRWCLHNAVEILEGNADRTAGRTIPGTRIPIYPVIGDELNLDGETDYRGMVTDAVDPQRMYNFWTSSIAETIGLTSKAPWIAAAGQIEEYLDDWKEANRKPHSVLRYDPKTVEGQSVPPPQRNVAEPPIQAMVLGLKESDQDLKAVMGLFEASLGERGPQQSGNAIKAVQQQGFLANSNYLDNLQRTKRAIGRSLLEWIPVIYDTARLVHLTQPDGRRVQAMVHAGAPFAPSPQMVPPDVTQVHDLSVGQYDVAVSTGPSFETQRQQTEQWLLDLFKVLPGLAAVGADIVLENADTPAAQQLAKRAKRMLPPQVQEPDDPDTALPRLQAENVQLRNLVQKGQAVIAKLAETIKGQTLQNQTKIQVAMIQAQAQIDAVMAKIGSDTNRAAFQAEYDRFTAIVDHIQTLAQQDADHTHALAQQEAAAAAAPPAQPGPAPPTPPGPPAS